MKTIDPLIQAKLDQLEGVEPLITVSIEWKPGFKTTYSIKNKILSIGNLQTLTTNNTATTEITLVLDDIDNSIKNILATVDVHKLPATVNLVFADTVPELEIFKGQISTPINWKEFDRTISLSLVSEIEGFEVGFSPEEGQLDFVTDEYIGKAWPLCFGNVVHVPAQKVSNTIIGTLKETLSIIDPILFYKIQNVINTYNETKFILQYWLSTANSAFGYSSQASTVLKEYINILHKLREVQKQFRDATTKNAEARKNQKKDFSRSMFLRKK